MRSSGHQRPGYGEGLPGGRKDGRIRFKSKRIWDHGPAAQVFRNQANAILEMRLYKLIGLELEALIKEHEETVANIYRYEDILSRKDSMAQVIMNELDSIKKKLRKRKDRN